MHETPLSAVDLPHAGDRSSRRDGTRSRGTDARAAGDGRAGISELAATVGASRDLVSHRLRHLIDHDRLRIVAALDPSVIGHRVLVHLKIDVDGPALPVACEVARVPDAVFVSMTSGALPVVVESRRGDVDELHSALDAIRGITGVPRPRLPVRVRRLIDTRVIRISALHSSGRSRTRFAIGIGITAMGDTTRIRDSVTASRQISSLESWAHYDVIKEDHARALGRALAR